MLIVFGLPFPSAEIQIHFKKYVKTVLGSNATITNYNFSGRGSSWDDRVGDPITITAYIQTKNVIDSVCLNSTNQGKWKSYTLSTPHTTIIKELDRIYKRQLSYDLEHSMVTVHRRSWWLPFTYFDVVGYNEQIPWKQAVLEDYLSKPNKKYTAQELLVRPTITFEPEPYLPKADTSKLPKDLKNFIKSTGNKNLLVNPTINFEAIDTSIYDPKAIAMCGVSDGDDAIFKMYFDKMNRSPWNAFVEDWGLPIARGIALFSLFFVFVIRKR